MGARDTLIGCMTHWFPQAEKFNEFYRECKVVGDAQVLMHILEC